MTLELVVGEVDHVALLVADVDGLGVGLRAADGEVGARVAEILVASGTGDDLGGEGPAAVAVVDLAFRVERSLGYEALNVAAGGVKALLTK